MYRLELLRCVVCTGRGDALNACELGIAASLRGQARLCEAGSAVPQPLQNARRRGGRAGTPGRPRSWDRDRGHCGAAPPPPGQQEEQHEHSDRSAGRQRRYAGLAQHALRMLDGRAHRRLHGGPDGGPLAERRRGPRGRCGGRPRRLRSRCCRGWPRLGICRWRRDGSLGSRREVSRRLRGGRRGRLCGPLRGRRLCRRCHCSNGEHVGQRTPIKLRVPKSTKWHSNGEYDRVGCTYDGENGVHRWSRGTGLC